MPRREHAGGSLAQPEAGTEAGRPSPSAAEATVRLYLRRNWNLLQVFQQCDLWFETVILAQVFSASVYVKMACWTFYMDCRLSGSICLVLGGSICIPKKIPDRADGDTTGPRDRIGEPLIYCKVHELKGLKVSAW